jgi:serine/threonine-protein kinase
MSIREKLPITIEIDLVYRDDMRALGAILAHEDTHLLLWLLGCRQTQGDRDEIRTDIAAIMLGLGDLLSNGRDRYRGNGRMESMGYLDSESVRYVQARMLQLQSKVVKGVVKMGRIKCQSCGSENNQDGDVFCGDCGTKMVAPQPVQPPPAVVQPLPPVVMPAPPQPVMQPAAPVAQPLSPVMQPPALSPAVVAKAKLVVKSTGRVGHEFPIHQEAVNIGRWDSDSGTFPEVDLTQDDAANVISRRHAKITVENGEFFLEDVGSVNGTYVNRGPRLMPGARQKLQNGDEVVMGRTFFTFVIE